MKKLIASATHENDIKTIIAKYWYAKDPIRLVEIIPTQWQVYQGQKRMEGFTVVLKRGRYRFEGEL